MRPASSIEADLVTVLLGQNLRLPDVGIVLRLQAPGRTGELGDVELIRRDIPILLRDDLLELPGRAPDLRKLLVRQRRITLGGLIHTAVKDAIKQRTQTKVGDITFVMKNGMLFITLPSGRRLAYVKPRIGENRFGGESVTYMGIDAQKKWSRIESYGPKFVENIVQAVSRDILAHAMQTLSHCFICGHVHDELIIECSPDVSLDAICEQMGRTPPWIPGIELRADGYECGFYQKQ